MMSESSRRAVIGNSEGDEFEKESGLLVHEQRQESDDRENELNLYRSGSAPPTVEGSLSAVGGLFLGGGNLGLMEFARGSGRNGFSSEEELRSDPGYLSYYYSNVNLNPRLPPPLLSREDWRFAQRLQGGSSAIGDKRNDSINGRPMFSMPPGFIQQNKQDKLVEWGGDGLIGLPALGLGLGLGNNQKTLVDTFQDYMNHGAPASQHPSRPASRNHFDKNTSLINSADTGLTLASSDQMNSASNIQNLSPTHLTGAPASYSYAAAVGSSLSRSSTPDPHRIARTPSPCPNPIGGGKAGNLERRNINSPDSFNHISSRSNETDLVAALSGMNLSNGGIDLESHYSSGIEADGDGHKNYLFNLQGVENNSRQQTHMRKHEAGRYNPSSVPYSGKMISSDSGVSSDPDISNTISSNNSYLKGSSNVAAAGLGLHSRYQHVESPNSPFTNYGFGEYSVSPISGQLGSSNLPPLFGNATAASAMAVPGMDSRVMGRSNIGSGRTGNQMAGNMMQPPYADQLYLQYLRNAEYAAAHVPGLDPTVDRNYMGHSYADLLQKVYLGNLLSPPKSQYGVPLGGKTAALNPHGYYTNPSFGIGLSYPGSPLASPLIPNSAGGLGSPLRHDEFNTRYAGGMKNVAGSIFGSWHLDNMDGSFASSLLEEFKSNKTKCFELSEIAGHVVEFSADQYGSRFIQQKLETATDVEKDMVFQEIFPQSLTLMTDVFGNYVIQKFLEHGLTSQRRELAEKLFGHILNLSLQMYGCRVIQKAIEVVDVDQKIKMVDELDGHVMRCVRDQNGNHVIQKCIECVPEDHIQFIISTFFDQVVTLSTHPYGCRVIQRVLEHCNDEGTQSKVMEEILGSVSLLAQDQYGNYVVQHVLEHGKPHERSQIIRELAGKIVQMSQQKFASNVVEKCLTFGDSSERELLVNEMLGTTDENEPLQAMMKDQFANYVVQKVLETCTDQERELILSRIKVHLNALKKYTYGKHIVARVEKLVAAGERRIVAGGLMMTSSYGA